MWRVRTWWWIFWIGWLCSDNNPTCKRGKCFGPREVFVLVADWIVGTEFVDELVEKFGVEIVEDMF